MPLSSSALNIIGTPEDEKSIVIVGMRGSGKSKMGNALADKLKWKFIDLDHLFVEVVGEPIKSFVEKYDWPAFRRKEEELLKRTVQTHPTKTIISTGKYLGLQCTTSLNFSYI